MSEERVRDKTVLLEELLRELIHKPDLNVNYLAENMGVTPQHVYDLTRHRYKTNPQTLIETKRLTISIEQLIEDPHVDLFTVF